jgi:hypothetical protein
MSSSLGRSLLACVIALGLSVPAFAQPKADPGSGPTNGAVSTNDAGSGPTKGLSQTAARPPPAIPTIPQETAPASPRDQSRRDAARAANSSRGRQ